jgi:hypothetical protein
MQERGEGTYTVAGQLYDFRSGNKTDAALVLLSEPHPGGPPDEPVVYLPNPVGRTPCRQIFLIIRYAAAD